MCSVFFHLSVVSHKKAPNILLGNKQMTNKKLFVMISAKFFFSILFFICLSLMGGYSLDNKNGLEEK